MSHIAVVGAGLAGLTVAARLRAQGYAGRITLFGAEPAPPYDRPPLSKRYLLGEMRLDQLYLRAIEFYEQNNIVLRLDTAVEAIHPPSSTLIAGGKSESYSHLVLTTGSKPRRLSRAAGGDLGGVFVLRTLADVDAIAPEFAAGRRVLIVGGGYIGLEAAAVAASKGLQVTLVEAAARILQRVAASETSGYFRALHLAHGVSIREGLGVSRLIGGARVRAAELADGSILDVDFVVVGIGIDPDTGLAEAAGLEIDNGIKTNALGQTSVANIWAAGDCASFPYRGRRVRLESVGNAIDQANAVADNILGAGKEYSARPWFWSDQYDVKLQIAGLSDGYDEVVVRPGEREGAQSVWYYAGDRLLAVDAMNDAKAYVTGRRLIEAGRSAEKAHLADPNFPLKDLLQA